MVNRLESLFPNLAADGYRITSPSTAIYNCFAWAAEENWCWWWPDLDFYWPKNAPYEESIEAFVQAYRTLGYEICSDAEPEADFEKVALYADANHLPTHAAKQLPSGLWSSKIGRGEDIEHATPDSLAGSLYGSVAQILKRPAKPRSNVLP